MCGQRRQTIDIKKMRRVPHRRVVRDEIGSSIPRMGQKIAQYLKCEAHRESSSGKE